MSEEDIGLRKELTQLKRFKNIIMPSKTGGKRLKSQRKEQRQRVLNKGQGARILQNIVKDRYATASILGVTSSSDAGKKKEQITKVISGPHKKGILIRANPALLEHSNPKIVQREIDRLKLEKKYIGKPVTRKLDDYPRNVSRKEELVKKSLT